MPRYGGAVSWNVDQALAPSPALAGRKEAPVNPRRSPPHVPGEPYTASQAAEDPQCSRR